MKRPPTGSTDVQTLLVGSPAASDSGKSAALWRSSAAPGPRTLSLDELSSAPEVCRRVLRAFGPARRADGGLDRALGEVFCAPRPCARLERLTHPLILREMERRLRGLRGAGLAVVDVPLLFEARMERPFRRDDAGDRTASRQFARVIERDQLSRASARRRIKFPAAVAAEASAPMPSLSKTAAREGFRSKNTPVPCRYQAFR